MQFLYMDDSYDREADFQVFSLIAIRDDGWHDAFDAIKAFRVYLRKQYGIGASEEIHAWKFVSGRGRPSPRILSKYLRSQIFKEILDMMVKVPSLQIFNACGPLAQQQWIFERLMNRVNRTLQAWEDRAILISDAGQEQFFNAL